MLCQARIVRRVRIQCRFRGKEFPTLNANVVFAIHHGNGKDLVNLLPDVTRQLWSNPLRYGGGVG